MKASSLSFQSAVLFVIAGMIWGIVMAISEDHSAMPAHAHLNLLGWVSLFLFGIFYHLHPAIDRSRTAMVQVCVWIAATVILAVGMAWSIRAVRSAIQLPRSARSLRWPICCCSGGSCSGAHPRIPRRYVRPFRPNSCRCRGFARRPNGVNGL
jgi:hypothetical protein